LAAYILLLFIVGLWSFNFIEKNEARINPEEGLIIAKPGTVYAAVPSEKLHNLAQFTIFIDLTTASNGLSAFEKIRQVTGSDLRIDIWAAGCRFAAGFRTIRLFR